MFQKEPPVAARKQAECDECLVVCRAGHLMHSLRYQDRSEERERLTEPAPSHLRPHGPDTQASGR